MPKPNILNDIQITLNSGTAEYTDVLSVNLDPTGALIVDLGGATVTYAEGVWTTVVAVAKEVEVPDDDEDEDEGEPPAHSNAGGGGRGRGRGGRPDDVPRGDDEDDEDEEEMDE